MTNHQYPVARRKTFLTTAGLDAVPAGTQVTDNDGDLWTKHIDGFWRIDPRASGLASGELLDTWGPVIAATTRGEAPL